MLYRLRPRRTHAASALFLFAAFASAPALAADDAEYVGEGQASYYGAEFAGSRTASGERFDPRGLTAAHRTLPLGSTVRVTNQRNGRSVVVRINDRGPWGGRRVLDLSKGAAEALRMVRSGVAPVKIELLRTGS